MAGSSPRSTFRHSTFSIQHSTFSIQHFSETPMKPATELIQHADGASRDAAPLTTPIYETTTFLFEDAADVVAYNEGRSSKYLYSRYANPTVAPVEQKIAALEGTDMALVLSSGQAATTTALMALPASGA